MGKPIRDPNLIMIIVVRCDENLKTDASLTGAIGDACEPRSDENRHTLRVRLKSFENYRSTKMKIITVRGPFYWIMRYKFV